MNIHIPNMPIKAAFFAHLILYIWAAQCSWIPVSYLFYNSIFLITILWTIHLRDSEEGPFMAVCINIISILLDIALFIMNWPSAGGWESHSRFGAVCGVANLLLRPVSSVILYRLFLDRAGTYGNFVMPSGIDSLFSTGRRAPYEDIDQTVAPPSGNGLADQTQKELGSPDSLFAS